MSIPSVSYTKLTQNGSECGKASVAEMNDEMNNYKTEVQPGATVTACEVYSVSDTSMRCWRQWNLCPPTQRAPA